MANPIQHHSVRVRVKITLVRDRTIEATMFCNYGPNAIQDVLNDKRTFIPVEENNDIILLSLAEHVI